MSEEGLYPVTVPTWKNGAPLCGKFGYSDSLEWTGKKNSFLVGFSFGSDVKKRTLIFFAPNAVVLSEVMFLFISCSPSRDHTSLAELLRCVARIPDDSITEKKKKT